MIEQEADQAKQQEAANVDGLRAAIELVRATPRRGQGDAAEVALAKFNLELAEQEAVGSREWVTLVERHGLQLAVNGLVSGLTRLCGYFADRVASVEETSRDAMLEELTFRMVIQAPVMPDEPE